MKRTKPTVYSGTSTNQIPSKPFIFTDKGIITESLNFNVKVFNSENNHKASEKQTNIEIVKDIYEYAQNNPLNILKIIICDDSKIIFNNISQKLKQINEEIENQNVKNIK